MSASPAWLAPHWNLKSSMKNVPRPALSVLEPTLEGDGYPVDGAQARRDPALDVLGSYRAAGQSSRAGTAASNHSLGGLTPGW